MGRPTITADQAVAADVRRASDRELEAAGHGRRAHFFRCFAAFVIEGFVVA
jgi:hypothetical protein